MLFEGGVGTFERRYLDTFILRCSACVSGTFRVNVRTDRHSPLGDSSNEEIGFSVGYDIVITVGAPRVWRERLPLA